MRAFWVLVLAALVSAAGLSVLQSQPAGAAKPQAKTATVVGQWSNAWGPMKVISTGSNSYEMVTTASTVEFPYDGCQLKANTVLGTFTGSASPYSGLLNVYDFNTCAFDYVSASPVTVAGKLLTVSWSAKLPTECAANKGICSEVWTEKGSGGRGLGKWSNAYGNVKIVGLGSGGYGVVTTSSVTTFPYYGCTIPSNTLLGTFSGTGPTYSGVFMFDGLQSCVVSGNHSATVTVNGKLLTITSVLGTQTWVKKASAAHGLGNWSNSLGEVSVNSLGANGYEVVTVGQLVTFPYLGCRIPANTVLGTFTGTGPGYTGNLVVFSLNSSCGPTGIVGTESVPVGITGSTMTFSWPTNSSGFPAGTETWTKVA